ncbi:chromosomal replication initiator protein DnaA [Candidatus Latescibacterota bacterium]
MGDFFDTHPPSPSSMSQDTHEIWARCLLNIERHVRPQSFNTWFRPTRARRFDAEILEIEVSSSYFADWVESNYLGLIQRAVEEETDQTPTISFTVADDTGEARGAAAVAAPPAEPARTPARTEVSMEAASSDREGSVADSVSAAPAGTSAITISVPEPPTGAPEAYPERLLYTPLNERYSFESFVVGEGNRLAHAAAQAVAMSPGKTQFNPLVIYGGVGLGKTHLLQAIGHHALSREHGLQVVYVPSEKFMNDFIESIRNRDTAAFKWLYRSADILLVDDIQFLLRGEETPREFFHTFNTLHQNGKQIAMTCDSPPGELEGLEERLISRFQWGLVTSIEPPDLETRIAILHQKAEINGIHLTDEVAAFLGNYVSTNIRELEGALNHIMAYCAVNQVELSVEAAKTIVQERLPAETTHLTIEGIQKTVARHFDLTPELLIGKTRRHEVASPRQIAMFLAKRLTSSPLKVIGLHFGNRDHSTVIHAVQTVTKKCEDDTSFAQVVETLTEQIQQQRR